MNQGTTVSYSDKLTPAGRDLVTIESCRSEASHCPNALIKISEWRQVIERWSRESNLSERLRGNIRSNRIFFHHRFRISISSCPNACSRPQIADVGLIGYVQPGVEPEKCLACGACTRVCPDLAITVRDTPPVFDQGLCQGCNMCRDACPYNCIRLSRAEIRILIGGKLGRHPHLGRAIGQAGSVEELIQELEQAVNNYFDNAKPGERFSDFCVRTEKHFTAETQRRRERKKSQVFLCVPAPLR